jgi:hypothetical protein
MPAWAGGWDNMFAQPYALLNEPNATARGIARLMSPQGARMFAAAAETLTGAVVGTPIPGGSGTYTQVTAKQTDGLNMGGIQTISTYTAISGNTTTAQHILVDQQLMPRFAPAPTTPGVETSGYPVDKSGNGGGSKAGTIN